MGREHVVPHQLEGRMINQMLDVSFPAGVEIVLTDHFIAFIQKSFAEVGAEKPCSAGNLNALDPVGCWSALLAFSDDEGVEAVGP